MHKILYLVIIIIVVLATLGIIFVIYLPKENINLNTNNVSINNFDDCIAAGNPAMESYPRQCRAGDKTYVEDIGNELDKTDLIRIDAPRPNQIVSSPIVITGQARGYWFFEGDFPIELLDTEGNLLATAVATAQSDWMTEDFVEFKSELHFGSVSMPAILVFKKDNPSGLPKNDDKLEMPVIIEDSVATICMTSSACEVPMRYLIQSNCPYQAFCENSSCVVACPMWEHSQIPEESKSYKVECAVNSDCDCSQWQGEYISCECLDGQCAAIVED